MTANTTSFKPGVSGNPSGRKPDKEIKELARAEGPTAIKTLATLMRSTKQPGKVRVAAAVALLDRGWGKPPIAITGGDADSPPIRLSMKVNLVRPGGAADRPSGEG